MSKPEIVLPYHLYQRIKASAGEHGGIGAYELFDGNEGESGAPLCVHGHAWGTCTRYQAAHEKSPLKEIYAEPELEDYISWQDNDLALSDLPDKTRIPFSEWCRRLNVKCGPKPETQSPETVLFAVHQQGRIK